MYQPLQAPVPGMDGPVAFTAIYGGSPQMGFDISRLRRSDRVTGVSAILFFIFLFLFKWYGVSSSSSVRGVNFSDSANGWHTFTNSRWIWIVTIIVALGAVAISAGVLNVRSQVQPGMLVAGLGALSAILIVYRIFDHPAAAASGTIGGVHYSASVGIKIGIWLGLIAALGVTYGGYLGIQDEDTSLVVVAAQRDVFTPPMPPPDAPPVAEPPDASPA